MHGEGEREVRDAVQISGPGRMATSFSKRNMQEKNDSVFSDGMSLGFLQDVDGTPEADGQPSGNGNSGRHWKHC